jgi:hypothetical protein
VPRIVLPITNRGLVLTDRICWGILGAAMVLAAGLILWLNRGTTFFVDELVWVYDSPNLSLGDVLKPYNGHLVATSKVIYKGILETLGIGYLPFRLLAVSTVLLSAGLFYALVKRRIGAVPALAPAIVLLFLGSDKQHIVDPVGFTVIFSVAAGLGALLALERGDRRGDIAACALLVVSVATYSTGLAFLVGVAISVLLRPDRRQRAWIFLVPLVLYAAWWVWALGQHNSGDQQTKLSNVLLIPTWFAESLAAVTSALAGLNFDYSGASQKLTEIGPGDVLAVLAVVALGLRIRRGNVPRSLWASIGIVLVFWVLGALAFGFQRPPTLARYLYMGAVGVLLVASDAARQIRFSRRGLVVLLLVAGLSLLTNIALMRDAGRFFRDQYSAPSRADFAMVELAGDRAPPRFDPVSDVPGARGYAPSARYLEVVDRYGSPAFSLSELQSQPEGVRQGADRVLASALDLKLEATPPRLRVGGCRRLRSEQFGLAGFELPAGGATLRAPGPAPATVLLGRFASAPAADVGSLPPGEEATLRIPTDSSPKSWRAAVNGGSAVEICGLGPGGVAG